MAVTTETAESEAPRAASVVLAAWPLLASILLLMGGSGLQGALLGVRAEQASFNSTVTGLVLGLYYLGYVGGSNWVPGMIRSVGHIRVFAALASMGSAMVIIHGIWVSPIPWMILRFITGVCLAGLFVVSESWLNEISTSRTRATLLAVYNTVVTAGLAAGTLLLNVADTAGVVLFVFGSVMLSMAAVPIALAPHEAPAPEVSESASWTMVFSGAPLGLIGAAMSGLAVGSILGFGAVYATRAGFGVGGASQFLVAVLIGAVAGQVPLGNWSDRTDRRIVMAVAAFLLVLGSAVGVAATVADVFPLALVAGALSGAGAFSLYGLSLAHQADYTDPIHMLSAGSRFLTANGLAAASGPILASAAIGLFGPEALFHLVGAAATLMGSYTVYRITRREAADEDHRAHYTPLPSGATMAALDDVVSETVGVESAELRRRRRRALRRMAFARNGRNGRNGSRAQHP